MFKTDEMQFLNKLDFLFPKIDNRPYYWVAGGSLLSALIGEKVNDYDIFTDGDPQRIIDFFKSVGAYETYENDWVMNMLFKGKKIQIIKKYTYGSMQNCINMFDFTCVSAAYDSKGFVCHDRFFLDAAQKRLVINVLEWPLSSMRRTYKYVSRGFKLCPVGMAQIARRINERTIDWDNPDENELEFYPDGTPMFRGID